MGTPLAGPSLRTLHSAGSIGSGIEILSNGGGADSRPQSEHSLTSGSKTHSKGVNVRHISRPSWSGDSGEGSRKSTSRVTAAAAAAEPPASAAEAFPTTAGASPAATRPWRFWPLLGALSTIALCGTLEGTIIINALPTVVAALSGDEHASPADATGGSSSSSIGTAYLWIPNAFFLASIATLPLYAQLSDIFGRKPLLLGALGLFILGCGIAGAANGLAVMIAARAIQGAGSGGMEMLVETVVMDLVPLRERSKYLSIVMLGGMLGASIGPLVGGVVVDNLGWRWIFWGCAVVGGASFLPLTILLKLKHRRTPETFVTRLRRIDLGGNAIFIASVVAVLLALTWAGPVYAWDSYHILLPLILGLGGFAAFTMFEWTPKLAPEPSFPRELVSNRTSAAGLMQAFLCAVIMYWGFYFLPIYFQSIRLKTPLASGIALLPLSASIVPFAIVSGTLLAVLGVYKPLHHVSWALLLGGLGFCSTLDADSSTGIWVGAQLVLAAGLGMLTTITLPVIQAPLDEKLVAKATAAWAFTRQVGAVAGVTVSGVVFDAQVRKNAAAVVVGDAGIASRLASGQAYSLATKAFLESIGDIAVRDQVIETFTRALRTVFYVGVAFAAVGFLVVFVEKEIALRKELNTEFGLEEDRPRASAAGHGEVREEAGAVELDDLGRVREERHGRMELA